MSIGEINLLMFVKAEYAVRGRLLARAMELEKELQDPEKAAALPFSKIVRCNIGNPQAVGQKPLTYVRQCLSLLMNPTLLQPPALEAIQSLYPDDVLDRARALLGAVPNSSVGAYSDSQGVYLVRQHVANFISSVRAALCGHSHDDVGTVYPCVGWREWAGVSGTVLLVFEQLSVLDSRWTPTAFIIPDDDDHHPDDPTLQLLCAQRDGFPAAPEDIFLTDGASAGVKALMALLIRGPQDAVLAPVPQVRSLFWQLHASQHPLAWHPGSLCKVVAVLVARL